MEALEALEALAKKEKSRKGSFLKEATPRDRYLKQNRNPRVGPVQKCKVAR